LSSPGDILYKLIGREAPCGFEIGLGEVCSSMNPRFSGRFAVYTALHAFVDATCEELLEEIKP